MTTTATTRPKWYDDKLIAYIPFARKCARKLAGNDDIEEVLQDFYLDACNRWAMFDKENYKFGTWVYQLVRNTCSNRRARAKAKKRAGHEISIDHRAPHLRDSDDEAFTTHLAPTPPSQHDYAELSAVLRGLSGTRDSVALMRLAMGDELQDVATDFGVSRERVRQLAERERGRLRERQRERERMVG